MNAIVKSETKKKSKAKSVLRYWPYYVMMLPALTYIFINNYIPMGGLVLAFKNYKVTKGIWGSEWCGFDNFQFLFASQDAFLITRNTILYNVAFIVIGTVVALAVAIFMNEIKGKVSRNVYQTCILMPYLISMVVVAYVAYGFLALNEGFINNVIEFFGGTAISWYESPAYWPFILIIVYLWKNVGYNSVIYVASISGIDPGLYEAAAIDGATKWQQIKNITLPCIRPTIITMTLLAIGRIFYSDFGLFYQVPMHSGVLVNITNTIDTYVYRGLMEQGNVGMSAAAGFYQSIVGFILILSANALVSKFSKSDAIF